MGGVGEASLMGDQGSKKRGTVDAVVLHGELKGAERDFGSARRGQSGDGVGHVMGHEEVVIGRDVDPRKVKAEALIEGQVRPTQGTRAVLGESAELLCQLDFGVLRIDRYISECRFVPIAKIGGQESLEVGCCRLDTLIDQVPEDQEVIGIDVQRRGVFLDGPYLCCRLRVAARFQGHVEFMEYGAVVLIDEQLGKLCRPDAAYVREVEIRPLP